MRLLSATTLCGAGGRATTVLRALLGSVPAGAPSPASASSSYPACDSSGIGSVRSYTSSGGDARGCSSTELQLTSPRGSHSIRGSGATVNSGSSQFVRLLVLRGTAALGCGSGGSDGLATRQTSWRRAALLHTSAGACGRETGGGDINNAAAGTREAPVEPPHEQHGNSAAILRELEDAERGGDPASVLQVVERMGHEFDEAALVAALRAVAHTAAGTGGSEQPDAGGAERLAANSTYQSLLSMVVAGSERLSPAQAVEVAASLGRLHLEDQMVLDSLGRNLVSRLHELSGSQLADLVEAYADSNASPGKVLADAVHQRLAGGSSGGGSGSQQQQQQPVDEGRVMKGRATADGVQLGTAGPGGERSGSLRLGELQGEDAERVRRGLDRLGYGAPGAAGAPPSQGQSDRSQGVDYA